MPAGGHHAAGIIPTVRSSGDPLGIASSAVGSYEQHREPPLCEVLVGPTGQGFSGGRQSVRCKPELDRSMRKGRIMQRI